MTPRREHQDEDEPRFINDPDGDVYSDFDLCEWCSCPRSAHAAGSGECSSCGRCKEFR